MLVADAFEGFPFCCIFVWLFRRLHTQTLTQREGEREREREREMCLGTLIGREITVKDLFRRERNLILNPNIENVDFMGSLIRFELKHAV
jgi:hypothetical protein